MVSSPLPPLPPPLPFAAAHAGIAWNFTFRLLSGTGFGLSGDDFGVVHSHSGGVDFEPNTDLIDASTTHHITSHHITPHNQTSFITLSFSVMSVNQTRRTAGVGSGLRLVVYATGRYSRPFQLYRFDHYTDSCE